MIFWALGWIEVIYLKIEQGIEELWSFEKNLLVGSQSWFWRGDAIHTSKQASSSSILYKIDMRWFFLQFLGIKVLTKMAVARSVLKLGWSFILKIEDMVNCFRKSHYMKRLVELYGFQSTKCISNNCKWKALRVTFFQIYVF